MDERVEKMHDQTKQIDDLYKTKMQQEFAKNEKKIK